MFVIVLVGSSLAGLVPLFPFALMVTSLAVSREGMVRYRSASSVRVSKVKGHATDAMIVDGKVRREDKEGNDAADIAADFGRLRQPANVIDARRSLLNAKKEWYPRLLSLHRFMFAIARESLNISENSGSVVDPLCWDCGSRTKARRVENRVVVDLAELPGPMGFWTPVGSLLILAP